MLFDFSVHRSSNERHIVFIVVVGPVLSESNLHI